MKKRFFPSSAFSPLLALCLHLSAVAGNGQSLESPQLLNHQGRIAVNGVNFEGTGHFKFALIQGDGSLVWSNSPQAQQEPEAAEAVPQAAVDLPVSKGLYSVLLGDTALANMAAIPASLFGQHSNLSLRVWFNDGTHGFQRITPDQRLASAPFAAVADQARNASNFLGDLAGDVTGTQSATRIAATTVTGKALTNFASSTGSISASDSILSAIGKLDGNLQGKASLASPSFTGTVSGITAGMVGLGNVSNTADADKPVSSAQQSALNAKANLASPTFTGTVRGITAEMVGLGNVDNTADSDKPVSAAQQTALNAKANLASPSFTGSVRLPAGTTWSSPIRLTNGVKLTNPVFGAVEFDGTNLYLTNNSLSPTRRTLAFTDGAIDSATNFTGGLAGDVTGTQSATSIAATTVTGKALTNFASSAGSISESDSILSAIGKLDGNLQGKANLASPTFTGTVSGISAAMVGLGNVDNTADAAKPVSTVQQTALNLKANLDSPTFTGTVGGISAAMVGLGNVDNTSDAAKPVSTAQLTALSLKANLDSPTFTGTVGGVSAAMVGLGNVDNTADAAKPVSTAQLTALSLKANLDSPTFTGTVGGISAAMVGLGNVNNTSDAAKPVSTAQQSALALKANLASPVFTGTVRLPAGTVNASPLRLSAGVVLTSPVFGAVEFDGSNLYLTNNSATPTRKTLAFTDGSIDSATNFTGGLAGDVTGTQSATSIAATTVTGKALTNFVSSTGSISASDSILSAIGKLDGNLQGKASLASPTFTGTVAGITKAMVGLGSVDNTSDAAKPVSTAQLTALNLKANLASPTFTGTVAGITKAMVGLGSVDNVSDADKPVSTAQLAALNLKANLASPVFTGTVRLPVGSLTAAPLRLAAGSSLTTPVFGSVEFDGTNLYLTNNSASPTRKTLAFTDGLVTNATNFTGNLAGDVTGTQSATSIAATTVTGKALTNFVSSTGSISASDSILSAIGKLDGNLQGKANLASPTFTGNVSGISPAMVGLGNVDNTSDAAKPVSTAQQTALNLKANLASPTFTGTVGGITKGMVGLGNVDNTTDAAKPVSTAQLAALSLKANLASPTFTGTVGGISKGMVGLGNVDNTNDAAKPVSTAQQTALDLKANLASPTFTGTVGGITKAMVDLGNVDNTSDAAKPVSTAQQTALNLKANLASPTFTGTVSGITKAMVGLSNVTNTNDTNKPVSGPQQAALDLKANLASPSFTGSVQLPAGTATSAPLKLAGGSNLTAPAFGAVEFDGSKLYLTTNAASPTRKTLAFTDSALNLSSLTAAPAQPVLAWGEDGAGQTTLPTLAQVAAVAAGENHSLALLDSGAVLSWGGGGAVPASLASVTAIAAGSQHDLAVKSDGSVVAWGGNDYGQASVPAGITDARQAAAGEKHSLILRANGAVAAWGDNSFGQSTVPAAATSNITAIAAGYDHSLALKSDGTVVAWGRNDAGQTAVPASLTGVAAIAAGAYHSLAVKADGTVVAWGWDSGGQSAVPAGLSGVAAVAGGYAFSAALKNDGSVVTWGDNSAGQGTIPSGATQVTQLVAGASHLLALRADLVPTQLARLDQDNVFTGKVGIRRTPAVHSLEVEGNASKTTASNWLANSDRRIKTDVATLTGALEKLDRVRLVDFRYTEDYRKAHPGIEDRRYLNVIAQEFAEVFPEHVGESGEFLADGSPVLQVDTYPLTIYSAAAVQELHRENQALKRQLADQEERLRKLEALMEKR
jgi:hypothetical protein